jgi:hypothetical protein
MASTNSKRQPRGPSLADVAVSEDTGEPDLARQYPTGQERRSRRSRLADLVPEDDSHAQGGAIAITFAVVSRKRWPR